MIRQVLEAVDYMHEQGVVHRDLKVKEHSNDINNNTISFIYIPKFVELFRYNNEIHSSHTKNLFKFLSQRNIAPNSSEVVNINFRQLV